MVLAFVRDVRIVNDGVEEHASPLTVDIVFTIFAVLVLIACTRFLTALFERIVVNDQEVVWFSRFGRVKVRCPLADVLSWKRTYTYWRGTCYRISTRKGDVFYTAQISRRAELDRFFHKPTGETIPNPETAPRHWTGSVLYRSNGGYAFILMLAFLASTLIYFDLWLDERKRGHSDYRIMILLTVACMAATLCSFARLVFESVRIEDDQLIYTNFWGRKTRFRLDDIQSVDFDKFRSIATVYAPHRTLRLGPYLNHLHELARKLQVMTASPDP